MDKQDERRRQIEAAAFEVLAEMGYRSTSMLQIAKRAAASNQTLYAWYGNKQTLFKSLIEENAHSVKSLLRGALDGKTDPWESLRALGPLLLEFTTGEKAVIMNRAAIADAGESGLLAEAIDSSARQEMVAMITTVMGQLVAAGRFDDDTDPADATETYLSLLFGEVPLRQAMGRLGPLSSSEITARADRALDHSTRLFGVGHRHAMDSVRRPRRAR